MALVLVVEDDPLLREGISYSLNQDGHRVVSAARGDRALDLIADGLNPTVVLLDLMLPGTNGWTVLDTLVSTRMEIPVIVMTGAPIPLATGASAVIAKPFGLAALRRVIQETVQELC